MAASVFLFLLVLQPLPGQERLHVDRFRSETEQLERVLREADLALQSNPGDFRALRRRAAARIQLGLLEEAAQDLRTILEREPESADAWADLGYVSWQQGNYSDALRAQQQAVRHNPEHPSASFYLGRLILLTGGDPRQAADYLEKAIELNPVESEIRFDLLTAYRAVGDTIRAAAQLQILQASFPPADPRLIYAEGLIAADLGQLDLAVRRFREALDGNPRLVGAVFDLGMALIQLERWPEAAEALGQVARQQPGSVEVAHLHALALFNARRQAEAEVEVARGIQLNNRYAPLFTLLGIMLSSQGEHARAVQLLKRAVLLAPDDFDAQFYLGRASFALRELEAALTALSRAVQLQPRHKDARFFLATTLESLGRGDQAEREYRRLLETHPADLEGNVGLGALLVKHGDPQGAIPLLERAIQQNPRHFEAQLALGRGLAQTGQLDEALSHLRTAALLDPESTEAHYQLGLVLRRLGRREEAEKEFAVVKQLNEKYRTSGMGMGPPERKKP